MTTRVGAKGQMVIPAKVRKAARIGPGDVLDVVLQPDGRLLVARLERPAPPRSTLPATKLLRRKGKHALLSMGRPLTDEEVRAALEDFP
jgi:AbrB family looped-hinge helix DNA binding protein